MVFDLVLGLGLWCCRIDFRRYGFRVFVIFWDGFKVYGFGAMVLKLIVCVL